MTASTALDGRSAIVFGGGGFIGSHVVAALDAAGARVTSFDLREAAVPAGVIATLGDITSPEAVREAVRGADHVFALAGSLGALRSIAEPVLDLHTSCEAQLVLLEAVREVAPEATVVFAGSRLEYGAPVALPVAESHPVCPESPYAIHKAACAAYYQTYARVHGLRTIVLRLPNPYGCHVRGASRDLGYGIVNLFVDTALDGGRIALYGGGAQLRDFVHVEDVARAALVAAVTPGAIGEILNIGSGEPHSLREAAELIVELCGRGSIDVDVPWPDEAASVETGDFYFDITRAADVLDWRPAVGFTQGLTTMVAGMREGRER